MKSFLTFAALLLLHAAPLAAAEREVRLERGFGTLYGTLRIPAEGARTAALLIAGSGPTDRNCNSRQQGLYTDTFLYLADALERQGIASLRYDKRGIGASRYDTPEGIYGVSLDDYIDDAAAWVDFLHDEGFEKVVLVGHSEGALIALCEAAEAAADETQTVPPLPTTAPAAEAGNTAAGEACGTARTDKTAHGKTPGPKDRTTSRTANDAAADTAAAATGRTSACTTGHATVHAAGQTADRAAKDSTVFAAERTTGDEAGKTESGTRTAEAGPSRRPDHRIGGVVSLAGPGYPIDRMLLTQLAPRLDIGTTMRLSEIFNALRQGKPVDDCPRELSALFQPYLQNYWTSHLKRDPQQTIRRVRVPVLIVGGTNDIQVPPTDAQVLKAARPDAELLLIEGMTHTLKQGEGRTAEEQMAVYMDASLPLDPTLAEAVPRFIRGL